MEFPNRESLYLYALNGFRRSSMRPLILCHLSRRTQARAFDTRSTGGSKEEA